ncbi:hypothetical protein DMN91_000343, partial [Ooceraea biroi]
MSLETRSSSALFKRAEQLKRWEQSETNREPAQPRQVARKIKFSADCVFLAACAASDKEEVVRLLQKGADINTGNVDGLTALHQACIDDDLDMVEFLVEQGADINRGDNEGWTPLHATASCGFISIAKYLIEQGCNLAAVNNDGELALDIAESDEMEDMLQQHINKAGIDCDQARSEEERSMLNDAKAWRSGAPGKDSMHPRSGATALHVATAKGYIKVMHILLQARCNVDAQDFDGWTPLHGAAHWGQLEACKLLVENGCDMDMKNYAGQTAFDVADADILKALEDLKEQQALMMKENPQTNNKKQSSIPKKRVSVNTDSTVAVQESADIFEEETPNKVKKVELEIQSDKEDSSTSTNSDVEATRETHMEESDGEGESETSSESHSSTFSNQSDKSNHATCLTDDEKKNRVNKDENVSHSPISPVETNKVPNQAPILPPKQQTDNNEEGVVPSWRRSGSFRNRMQSTETTNSTSTSTSIPNKVSGEPEVVLRRTHSFETDEKFYEQYLALRARIKTFSCPTLHRCNAATPTHTNATTRSASLRETHRSFVPPVRDEESETQRKAHAKRVRETRRSTQGVTLDEIKSAEQLVKKKQQNNESPVLTPSTQSKIRKMTVGTHKLRKRSFKGDVGLKGDQQVLSTWTWMKLILRNKISLQVETVMIPKSITMKKGTHTKPTTAAGLRAQASTNGQSIFGNRSRIGGLLSLNQNNLTYNTGLLGTKSPNLFSGSSFLSKSKSSDLFRKNPYTNSSNYQNLFTTYGGTVTGYGGMTLPSHTTVSPLNLSPSPSYNYLNARPHMQKTESFNRSKIKPSLSISSRSSSLQSLTSSEGYASGNDRSGRTNRLGSISSLSEASSAPIRLKSNSSENGELDYKKLYEESQAENERLKDKLKRSDEQLKEVRHLLEKAQTNQNKVILSEAEKRERRAMERKLSEMEEELK